MADIFSIWHTTYSVSPLCSMKCPFCSKEDLKVLESRDVDDSKLRRRRECLICKNRFTTYETIETTPIRVVKKGGKIESFDRNKVMDGIIVVHQQAQH